MNKNGKEQKETSEIKASVGKSRKYNFLKADRMRARQRGLAIEMPDSKRPMSYDHSCLNRRRTTQANEMMRSDYMRSLFSRSKMPRYPPTNQWRVLSPPPVLNIE